jgi:hypothetical protein
MRNGLFCGLMAATAGCHGDTVMVGNDLTPIMTLPATPNRDVDMLFVIDDSPSTADKQASLIASFPTMMDALDSLPGGRPNLHIGVVSTDMGTQSSGDAMPGPEVGSGTGACIGMGDDGVLQHAVPVDTLTGSFIADVANPDGTRAINYTGGLRDVFAQIAQLGSNGCGFEQPLAAMRRALTNPMNAGFVRPDANLAVVFLTDEDDCSMSSTGLLGLDFNLLGPMQSFRCTRFGVQCSDSGMSTDDMNQVGPKSGCIARTDSLYVEDATSFIDFLTGIKTDPGMVMVSAIAGDPTPVDVELRTPPGGGAPITALGHSCSYTAPDGLEVADPAVRINEVVQAFPEHSSFSTICNDDLTVSLGDIGDSARRLVGDSCLPVAISDTDPAAGVQPQCAVTEGTTDVPACGATAVDECWRLVDDATHCARSPQHLRLEIVRSAGAPAGRSIQLSCLTR